jgi:methylmalonyl-CoA mutase N-terminal domain/subunit
MAAGEVGRVGVAISSLDDMRRLFHGIRLDDASTSMTINSTAAILLAFIVALGDEQGVPRSRLAGTVQNDVLKEYVARGTYVYPVERSLRLVADIIAFCAREVPKWNPISISGYHMREAGSTAPQEVGFTLADGLEYVERALGAGLDIETFAPRLSFFFAAHNDLLEEVAKFRAARRLWATLLRGEFGAGDDACKLRFHTQTGGSTLTAQQPLVNVVRVAVQALAAVCGGTQSLHTNSYDEALALPTTESAKLALRTQQVIAHESGATRTVDPLAGSYYVEFLTAEIERRVRSLLDEIEKRGGAARCIADGFFQEEIARSAYAEQQAIERGEEVVVGVNRFTQDEEIRAVKAPDYTALAAKQVAQLAEARQSRDQARVARAVENVRRACATLGAPLMEPILEAVRARATLGEISSAMEAVWGRHEGPLTLSARAG